AATAALIALASWNVWLQFGRGTSDIERIAGEPAGRVVPLAATSGHSGTGRLFISEDGREGGLAVTGMAELPPGAGYWIWFIRRDQTRVPAGWFRPDSRGQAVVKVAIPSPLDQFTGVALTIDPTGARG